MKISCWSLIPWLFCSSLYLIYIHIIFALMLSPGTPCRHPGWQGDILLGWHLFASLESKLPKHTKHICSRGEQYKCMCSIKPFNSQEPVAFLKPEVRKNTIIIKLVNWELQGVGRDRCWCFVGLVWDFFSNKKKKKEERGKSSLFHSSSGHSSY